MWINENGSILEPHQFDFYAQNRAFRYGDGIFESIRMVEGKIPLAKYHLHRICKSCNLLSIFLPDSMQQWAFWEKEIHKLSIPIGIFRIRIAIFRHGNGLYTPAHPQTQFLIEVTPLHEKLPFWNPSSQEKKWAICSSIRLPIDAFSGVKSLSSMRYVMAALFKQQHQLDECILLNTQERISEASSSNLFLWRNESTLCTPPIEEGCVDGVFRQFLIDIATQEGLSVEKMPISIQEFYSAKEIFSTNAIQGILPLHKKTKNWASENLVSLIHKHIQNMA